VSNYEELARAVDDYCNETLALGQQRRRQLAKIIREFFAPRLREAARQIAQEVNHAERLNFYGRNLSPTAVTNIVEPILQSVIGGSK